MVYVPITPQYAEDSAKWNTHQMPTLAHLRAQQHSAVEPDLFPAVTRGPQCLHIPVPALLPEKVSAVLSLAQEKT